MSELEALLKIESIMEGLDTEQSRRVLIWLHDKYGHHADGLRFPTANQSMIEKISANFSNFAEFYDIVQPKGNALKALCACYWFDYLEHGRKFNAQILNSELKQLGHGISNITAALTALKDEKPSLVLQVKKSGTSRQARKEYQITESGRKRIDEMIGDRDE